MESEQQPIEEVPPAEPPECTPEQCQEEEDELLFVLGWLCAVSERRRVLPNDR